MTAPFDRLKGSMPPLITPFRNGGVDEDAYQRLVEFQIDNGSHGIVVNGKTSQPASPTVNERNRLVTLAVEATHGRVPVVAATGSQNIIETRELTSHGVKAGADAQLIVTPYYSRPPQRGLIDYYLEVTKAFDGSDRPKFPSLFVRFPESFVGPDEPLLRPPESEQLDYEGEIVLVMGKAGRRVPRATALGHVFGVTIANEGSIRDWLRHAKFNVTQGKNFARSGSLRPWIVPLPDLSPGPMRVSTRVNGEVRQNDTTDRMIFPFDRIIEYISSFATLEPGDIILMGTPSGAGARFDPPRHLKAGDMVEVEVSGIGTLRNPVADKGIHG